MLRIHALALLLFLAGTAFAKQDRNKLVKDDRQTFAGDAYWIYNDLDKGIARAKKSGRPLLIVFR